MQALTFFFAFVAVLALIGVAAWLVRRRCPSLPKDAQDTWAIGTSKQIRGLIVSTYEWVSLALVIIPTVVVTVGAAETKGLGGYAVIIPILTFLVTAFIAGGALTLVSIADNTLEAVRILQRMEQTALLPIATDVHRIEGTERDARNQAAISAAILPGDTTAT